MVLLYQVCGTQVAEVCAWYLDVLRHKYWIIKMNSAQAQRVLWVSWNCGNWPRHTGNYWDMSFSSKTSCSILLSRYWSWDAMGLRLKDLGDLVVTPDIYSMTPNECLGTDMDHMDHGKAWCKAWASRLEMLKYLCSGCDMSTISKCIDHGLVRCQQLSKNDGSDSVQRYISQRII